MVDVYKRQEFCCKLQTVKGGVLSDVPEAPQKSGYRFLGWYLAVSYTHLDVYKRQAVELVMKYGDIYELTIQSIKEVQEAM